MAFDASAPSDYNSFPDPAHPFVDGQSTAWATAGATVDNVATRNRPIGATEVATLTIDGGIQAAIVDIPAAADSFGHGDFGDRRVLFTTPDYPDYANQEFADVLTVNAQQILANIVEELSPLEPANVLLVSVLPQSESNATVDS